MFKIPSQGLKTLEGLRLVSHEFNDLLVSLSTSKELLTDIAPHICQNKEVAQELLQKAYVNNKMDLVRALIDHCPELLCVSRKVRGPFKYPFLMKAIKDGNIDIVKLFLKHAPKLEQSQTTERCTFLIKAIKHAHNEIAALLLENEEQNKYLNNRALVDGIDDGGGNLSALDAAIAKDNKKITKLLLKKSAPQTIAYALEGAALKDDNVQALRRLLKHLPAAMKKDPSITLGDTHALHRAAQYDRIEAAQLLVQSATLADLMTEMDDFGTALTEAVVNEHREVAKLLFDRWYALTKP